MAQTAKIFMMNTARSGGTMIDTQINRYLEEHPKHHIKTVSYVVVGMMEKALVIFEYPDAKTQEIRDSAMLPKGNDNLSKHTQQKT